MQILMLMMPVILIVIVGYVSARFGLLSEESNSTFTKFTFYIAMPCQLFLDFSKTPVSQAINLHYILAFALCVLLVGSFIYIISKYYFNASLSECALNIMGSSQVNTAYFAIPLFLLIFNNATPVIPILIFQVVILTTIVLLMIEHDLSKNDTKKYNFIYKIPLIFVKNPIILASMIGLMFSAFHMSVPIVGEKFFDIVGATAAPLALFALGQSLFIDLKNISKSDLPELLLLCFLKLLILPLLAYVVGKYLFHLDHLWLASLIIMSAMPAPKNMFIFAVKYKLNSKKSASVVAMTTVCSFVTLNILMMIFKSYF